MVIIELEETASTNSYLSGLAREGCHGLTVVTRAQTAGRGQRGNSWEAAPGENITMSVLLRPDGLSPDKQFRVSEAVSVAIVNVLRRYLPADEVAVKWPNDIYVGDMKICGILIENSVTSKCLNHSIAGIGINVNQRKFLSDAPNPVSMAMLTGLDYPLRQLTEEFVTEILAEMVNVDDDGHAGLHERYLSMLWRSKGYWPYIDNLRGERIMARIAEVAPNGILTLALRPDGGGREERRVFAFKEVAALLESADMQQ